MVEIPKPSRSDDREKLLQSEQRWQQRKNPRKRRRSLQPKNHEGPPQSEQLKSRLKRNQWDFLGRSSEPLVRSSKVLQPAQLGEPWKEPQRLGVKLPESLKQMYPRAKANNQHRERNSWAPAIETLQ